MLPWLNKKKMTGGLVFGPPAWHPDRIEDTFDGDEASAVSPAARIFPDTSAAQAALLDSIGIARTSAVIPALAAQLRALTPGLLPTLVLSLLPTQPEFATATAISHLALPDLLAGLEALANHARKTLVVIDRHDHKLHRLMKRAAPKKTGAPAKIILRTLLNRYPQGDPTILLRALFGRRLPVGALPTTAGVLLVDPIACWALGRWLRTGQPLTDRPVQVFSDESRGPHLLLGRIGETLAEFCMRHQLAAADKQIILNGMLAGREVELADTRIAADTESITIRQRPDTEEPAACLSCGWCVDVCPTALRPIHLLQLAQTLPADAAPAALPIDATRKITATKDAHESLHCIACGLCTYVCPTRLPLMRETLRLRTLVAATVATPHAEAQT